MALLTDKMVTDEFVADLLRDSFLPAVQSQWTHQRLLDVAYDEVLQLATALTMVDHSHYREADSTTLVASQSNYDTPRYAMLNKIHLAQLLDTTGAIGQLERIDPAEELLFKDITSGHPARIRIDGTQIVLNPTPTAADILTWPTLQTYIYRRPSRMVRLATAGTNTGRAAVVSSVAGTTVTYTASVPTDFTSSSVHDFYKGTSPFRRIGTAITAVTKPGATSQTFSAANAALLTAGDFVCMRDETCVVPVPGAEFLPYLRQLVIGRIAMTQKDQTMYQNAEKKTAAYIATLVPAATNRLQNNLSVVSLYNSPFLSGIGRGTTMVRS